MRDRILSALYGGVDAVNEQLPESRRLAKTPTTIVFGERGTLDSLAFVNFVLSLEQELDKEFGVSIPLAEHLVELTDRERPESLEDLVGFVETFLEPRVHAES